METGIYTLILAMYYSAGFFIAAHLEIVVFAIVELAAGLCGVGLLLIALGIIAHESEKN